MMRYREAEYIIQIFRQDSNGLVRGNTLGDAAAPQDSAQYWHQLVDMTRQKLPLV